jgi:hypothetical protein
MKSDFNPQCITYSQMNLIFNVRIAWRRLTTWVRAYIISRYAEIGTEEELFRRLYLEVLEFSDMIQPIFGRENAQKNSIYLNKFTLLLRDLISAQLSGNSQEVQKAVDSMFQNVNDTSAFLASINPFWNQTEWKEMLDIYLRDTIQEANYYATGNYKKDIETFDQITLLTNTMGDVFARGLYDYLTSGKGDSGAAPAGIAPGCITWEQMNEIYQIRMFWFELITWVRAFMLSRFYGLGDENEVFVRLKQVSADYVNALKRFFGDIPATDELQRELDAYVSLLDSMITAQLAGKTDDIGSITKLLYQNAAERAASVSKLNPNWSAAEWRSRLFHYTRATIDESTSFLTKDYARNLDIFSTLLDQAESTSGYFALGLNKYLENHRTKAERFQ